MMLTALLILILTVPASVVRVYDGDTVHVRAEIWPGLAWTGAVRVRGVDTPELRGKCAKEKAAAVAARDFVKLVIGDRVTLSRIKHGKFARRVVASVQTGTGEDLAALLLRSGHARPYDGGSRSSWCEGQ